MTNQGTIQQVGQGGATCRAGFGRAVLAALLAVATAAPARAGDFGTCMEDQYGGSLGCTSGDVRVTDIGILSIIDGCTGPSDTATVTIRANLLVGANTRYDVAYWLALDNGNARTGSCFKEWLAPAKSPRGTDPTVAELLGGSGPYLDGDGDACGDAKASYGMFQRTLSTAADPTVPRQLVFPCRDIDANGNLDFAVCAGWKNQSNVDCSGLAAAGIPDNTSKCHCAPVNINVGVPAADPVDWGDAPDSYATLSSSNGARHTTVGTAPRLGACVDAEANGLPNVAATGDDSSTGTTTAGTCATAGDDEDGVTFGPLVPGEAATITVTATAACTLSAFIDWGQDGSFATAGDDLLPTGQLLAAGANTVNVDVPAGAPLGNTYARLRCTTAGKVSHDGLAADGELEDYRIQVMPLPASLSVVKKAMLAGGTCGVDDVSGTLDVFAGQQVEYCYYATAAGPPGARASALDVQLVDDMATPADPSDDQVIGLTGLVNLGGSPSIGDLAAGSTATGKSAPVQF